MKTSGELIVALDLPDRESTLQLLSQLRGELSWAKVGLSLFCRYGPQLVDDIRAEGFKVFLDLKLHDIPHQLATALRNLSGVPANLLTIHASGGAEMMQAAVAARNAACPGLKLLAVTVLTSHDENSLRATGVDRSPAAQVELLARLALDSGMDGLVCSPLELEMLRAAHGADPILLAPGIRPTDSSVGDQKRVMTPAQALAAGATFLVVGRPITSACDPRAAARAIQDELRAASA